MSDALIAALAHCRSILPACTSQLYILQPFLCLAVAAVALRAVAAVALRAAAAKGKLSLRGMLGMERMSLLLPV